MTPIDLHQDPIVITGIGMVTAVGKNREEVWQALKRGESGVGFLKKLEGIPDDYLIGAQVDVEPLVPGEIKPITLGRMAAKEALEDAAVDLGNIDRDRFACAVAGHFGDISWFREKYGLPLTPQDPHPWWHRWMPNTSCSLIANEFGLNGPRLCHSTACASGLVSVLTAVRSIRDDQCDIALAGAGDALNSLFAAGFHKMRVLAKPVDGDPRMACRPFDRRRGGFVMGEGAAMFVVERLSHALARGATIYAEISAGKMLAEAHHVTNLTQESDALTYLISATIRQARLTPAHIGYINAHGTGTEQNDLAEMRGIRNALGRDADNVSVSATKSMIGHLVNAAGCAELAVTALAMRDGFAPPTINLTEPDPECSFDCLPLYGRATQFQHALKISVAFGGHLVAVALNRWNDAATGFAYPAQPAALRRAA